MSENIIEKNKKIFSLLSDYINFTPDAICREMVEETAEYCHVSREEAFRILISGILDVYSDKVLMNGWIRKMFRLLLAENYEQDPYLQTVSLSHISSGRWELTNESYKPYELFVFNDPVREIDGKLIPMVGYFQREYSFPCVKQGGREWMLITPNEIETMKRPIAKAFGDVVTYGLGLGYFPFMVSAKDSVESVTVIEKDESIIRLFEKHLLWQFPFKEKIRIICADAFEYAAKDYSHDFVFADIWHDPSDGVVAYKRLKALEKEGVEYAYWIEDTLKLYM